MISIFAVNDIISIHAPAKERLCGVFLSGCSKDFNPRSRKGATELQKILDFDMSISIHAPAKERRQFYTKIPVKFITF